MSDVKLRQMQMFLERWRRIKKPIYELGTSERERFEATPLEKFFSPEFLAIVYGDARNMGSLYTSTPNVLRCIKSQWPDVRTVEELVKKLPTGIYELAALSGFGGSALAVLVESLCAFGYDIAFKPDMPERQATDRMRKAWELAHELGISK